MLTRDDNETKFWTLTHTYKAKRGSTDFYIFESFDALRAGILDIIMETMNEVPTKEREGLLSLVRAKSVDNARSVFESVTGDSFDVCHLPIRRLKTGVDRMREAVNDQVPGQAQGVGAEGRKRE